MRAFFRCLSPPARTRGVWHPLANGTEYELVLSLRMSYRGAMGDIEQDVLVVGAGPTGLALACALAQWRVPVRVVDAAAGPSYGSRAKGVQPRTLEVLDGLGVAGRLVAGGRWYHQP